MPEITPNLEIKKPKGYESVTRDSFNENWDIIDQNAAKKADLDMHLAETVQKTDLTINVPTEAYPTVQEALDSLKYTWIPSDVTVTIQIAEGTYTHDSAIVVNHPCGNQIQIVGATPVTTPIASVGDVDEEAGAWVVPINVDSTSGINIGEYVIIKDTEGEDENDYDHVAHRGIWEITAVSDEQITVTNTHRQDTFPAAKVNGGTAVVLKTILKFSKCDGVIVADNNSLGLLDAVALVGDGSSNSGLLVGGTHNHNDKSSPAFCLLGGNFGVNGFGSAGIYAGYGGSINAYNGIASSGNSSFGYYSTNSSSIYAAYSTSSGNGTAGYNSSMSSSLYIPYSTSSGNNSDGYYVSVSANIYAYYSTSSGNGSHGYYVSTSSSIYAAYSTSSGNINDGYHVGTGASIYATSSTSSGNGKHGYYVSTSASIYANSSTSSGNDLTDYHAVKMGCIYCNGYKGSPLFSPAIGMPSSDYGLITT